MGFIVGRGARRSRKLNHAITDLYDEERKTFLLQYPVSLIVVLGLLGVAAFALTGFLGYRGTPSYQPFRDPIALLLWLYALQITLEVSIFRHKSLAAPRYVVVGVTLVAVTLLALAYYNTAALQAVIQQYLQGGPQAPRGRVTGPLADLATNPWTYTILNFGILAIFWLDTARRWVRRAMGLPPNPEVDLGLGDEPKSPELPRVEDMISGDLLAATVLALALALVLQPSVVGSIVPSTSQPLSCLFALPGTCPGGSVALTDINILLALVTLPFALIILGLSAILNGLGSVGGVNTSRSRTMVGAESGAARRAVSQEVSLTVLKTLQSALDRRIRGALAALILSLRNIAWPLLIMCSVVATGVAGELVERYLHDTNKTGSPALVALVVAVALGGVAALFTVLSAALVPISTRVATNSLKFLSLIAFIVLLTFWMFSLALTGFNVLLLAVGWTARITVLSACAGHADLIPGVGGVWGALAAALIPHEAAGGGRGGSAHGGRAGAGRRERVSAARAKWRTMGMILPRPSMTGARDGERFPAINGRGTGRRAEALVAPS